LCNGWNRHLLLAGRAIDRLATQFLRHLEMLIASWTVQASQTLIRLTFRFRFFARLKFDRGRLYRLWLLRLGFFQGQGSTAGSLLFHIPPLDPNSPIFGRLLKRSVAFRTVDRFLGILCRDLKLVVALLALDTHVSKDLIQSS